MQNFIEEILKIEGLNTSVKKKTENRISFEATSAFDKCLDSIEKLKRPFIQKKGEQIFLYLGYASDTNRLEYNHYKQRVNQKAVILSDLREIILSGNPVIRETQKETIAYFDDQAVIRLSFYFTRKELSASDAKEWAKSERTQFIDYNQEQLLATNISEEEVINGILKGLLKNSLVRDYSSIRIPGFLLHDYKNLEIMTNSRTSIVPIYDLFNVRLSNSAEIKVFYEDIKNVYLKINKIFDLIKIIEEDRLSIENIMISRNWYGILPKMQKMDDIYLEKTLSYLYSIKNIIPRLVAIHHETSGYLLGKVINICLVNFAIRGRFEADLKSDINIQYHLSKNEFAEYIFSSFEKKSIKEKQELININKALNY